MNNNNENINNENEQNIESEKIQSENHLNDENKEEDNEINNEINEELKQTEKSENENNNLEKNEEQSEKLEDENLNGDINEEIKQTEKSEIINKEESKESNDDEMTIVKEVDAEITNIVDKDKLRDKNLYFSIYSHNNEVYSTKEGNKINDIIQSLPFTFQFNLYSSTNEEKMKISILLKNEEDDSIYSETTIELDAQEKNLSITDQFILQGEDEIRIFMKFTINTIENI